MRECLSFESRTSQNDGRFKAYLPPFRGSVMYCRPLLTWLDRSCISDSLFPLLVYLPPTQRESMPANIVIFPGLLLEAFQINLR